MKGPGPRRANLRLLALGLGPPLVLMALAWFLDGLWARFHESGIFTWALWIGAAAFLAVIIKAFYLPWLLHDRRRIGNKALETLALLLILAVFASGYKDVGIALSMIGIVVLVKRRRDGAKAPPDDESSWAYVGEPPPEAGEGPAIGPADPHEVLGVARNAGPEEIRAAYRRIIKECHPDSRGGAGDSARFRQAVEAYEKLQ